MNRIDDILRARDHLLVFDDYLTGTTPAYSLPDLNELLARPDQFAVFLFASETTGTAPNLELLNSTGPDELNWSTTGESSRPLAVGGETSWSTWSGARFGRERSAFFRMQFSLDEPGASTRLRVWFTDREDGV